jgi:hypothetical protein
MKAYYSALKEKMLELTRLFCIETNIFNRFVIIYKYITLIDKDPITKGVLQKIFDNTANMMGEAGQELNEDKFLNVKSEVIHTNEFWVYYSNLKIIYSRMKKIKECKICEKKEYDDLCRLFSKPYSKDSLKLSFKVVNSSIFEHLDQTNFLTEDDEEDKKTWFDEKRSTLWVKGEKIVIGKQDKIGNAHKLLRYIFISNKDNLKDDFFYSEMAEDEFEDFDEYKENHNRWRRYHAICCEVNKKIEDVIKIKDFLKYNTGRKGKFIVNKKYL